VEENKRAFEIGRWSMARPDAAAALIDGGPAPETDVLATWERHLTDYQSARLARRWRGLVDRFDAPEMREAVATSYGRLLAPKDEYEVARLLLRTGAQVAEAFGPEARPTYHLAPPMLARTGPDGRPVKRTFGPWARRLFAVLAPAKVVRGTWLDPFRWSGDRALERRLLRQFEDDMARLLDRPPADCDAALALARLPQQIRGFGPVKAAAAETAAQTRAELLRRLDAAPPVLRTAAE